MAGFTFEEKRGHSVVRFLPDLLEMSWGDVEKEAAEIVEKIKSTETARLIIDLTGMELIQSGLVASLVRMWKATDGWYDRKVVVAADKDIVREVIRSAGLLNLMTVVSSMDEAGAEIRISTKEEVRHREKRVVAWAVLPIALFSAATLYPVLFVDNPIIRKGAETTGMLAAGFACIASIFSMVKDDGIRRGLGILSMIISVAVLGTISAHRSESEEEQPAPNPLLTLPKAPAPGTAPAIGNAPDKTAPKQAPPSLSSPATPSSTNSEKSSDAPKIRLGPPD